jgi:hypothetical protein
MASSSNNNNNDSIAPLPRDENGKEMLQCYGCLINCITYFSKEEELADHFTETDRGFAEPKDENDKQLVKCHKCLSRGFLYMSKEVGLPDHFTEHHPGSCGHTRKTMYKMCTYDFSYEYLCFARPSEQVPSYECGG